MENSQTTTNQEKRINWILENWTKFRFGNYPWGADYKKTHTEIIAQMKADGVLAKKTMDVDVNLSRMIERARKIKHPHEANIEKLEKQRQREFAKTLKLQSKFIQYYGV